MKRIFWYLFGPFIYYLQKRFNKTKRIWEDHQCPHCGEDSWKRDKSKDENLRGGKGYNWEFGMVEYWFELKYTCNRCAYRWELMDSSL